ncbi:MAG: transcriptional repressor LexA [Candidatus Binatia bacterium]
MYLTKRQKELFDFLGGYLAANGYAPTLEEIGVQFKLNSLATVHKHLTNLEQKGVIRRTWNHSRAIELVPPTQARSATALPLLGRVAAGRPIEALETSDDITVPDEFIRRENTFVLRVVGSSMVGDGILDGDYIVVEERPTANNGETVVATLDGEATVKRFYRDKPGTVRLQPANDAMSPIICREKDLAVRGVVVAVLRKY